MALPLKKAKPETPSKLCKAVVLYFDPGQIGSAGGAACNKCLMYVPEAVTKGHCTTVEGSIDGPKGICGLYVFGKHIGPDMRGKLPKAAVGYAEEGPTHCASCEYFLASFNACKKVDGYIEAQGCCNGWEAK